MKKPYTLDYSIDRDVDRLAAVQDILDKLDKNPSPTELEQMGSYILYGKDENGKNAYQRGEMLRDARYNSYRTKDDSVLSLDAILDNPLVDQQEFRDVRVRDPYIQPRTTITRPKYDKKTGELLDAGDSDIPGMKELWECIDRNEHWIAVLEGRVTASGGEMIFSNPYRLYKLKHALIDIRRHQYYLKDSYKPTIRFLAADHPKRQYIDWSSDSYYWISREEWERRVSTSYFPLSKNISDYEQNEEETMVKWVVRRHTFDWENIWHIRALIPLLSNLRDLLWDKLWTEGHALLMDFERYRALCRFSEVRNYIIDLRAEHYSCGEIREALQLKYGILYSENHISSILYDEIPKQFVRVATKCRLIAETPQEDCLCCRGCGKTLPKNPMFFSINRNRKIGYSPFCKECEKIRRVMKGAQQQNDGRNKETKVLAMQAGKT